MSDRLDSLRWALDVVRESIEVCEPDKRSPLVAQFRAILGEIAELEGVDAGKDVEVNGLVKLQDELAKRRQSGSKGARRTGTRTV